MRTFRNGRPFVLVNIRSVLQRRCVPRIVHRRSGEISGPPRGRRGRGRRSRRQSSGPGRRETAVSSGRRGVPGRSRFQVQQSVASTFANGSVVFTIDLHADG